MMPSRLPVAAVALLAVLALPAVHASAPDLVARFHPAAQVWAYPVEDTRSIQAVLVHNTALVNGAKQPVTLEAVTFEVHHAGSVVSTVHLDAQRLDGLASRAHALGGSGLLRALDFQFAPAVLLADAAPISDSRTLAPGAALLLFHQLLTFRGEADRLQVTVRTADGRVRSAGGLAIRHGAAATVRFPLEGRWLLGAGATPHSHHRWAVPEEFALDLVQIGTGGRTHRGAGDRMDDYHAYGAPVLAVAAGDVVRVHDGDPDNVAMLRRPDETLSDYQQRLRAGQAELLGGGADAIAGNHVIIRHADGIYGVYAHLKPGSIAVAAGTRVEAGQRLAAVGGSGNSTEPHLHFHLCDAPRALHCSGLPVAFGNIEIPWSEGPRALQSGDYVTTRESPAEATPSAPPGVPR